MLDAHLDKILNTFGERVTKLARINLGKSKRGKRIDSSGKLRKSLGYKLNKSKNDVTFSFENYGIFVDAGVVGKKNTRIMSGWDKSLFKRGRYKNKPPPFAAIRKWIDNKPIRPRNLNSGRFVSSKGNIKDKMAGAIRMSIYLKGKQPTLFFSDPFNDEFKKLPDDLLNGFGDDILIDLKK